MVPHHFPDGEDHKATVPRRSSPDPPATPSSKEELPVDTPHPAFIAEASSPSPPSATRREASDDEEAPPQRGEQSVMADVSREEIDAKLQVAEARTEARFAQLTGTLDVRFANLDNKIDKLADSVARLSSETEKMRFEVSDQNKTTRSTMIVTAIVSVIAIIGIILAVQLTSQSNLLSAFQAGLAVKTFQAQPPAKP